MPRKVNPLSQRVSTRRLRIALCALAICFDAQAAGAPSSVCHRSYAIAAEHRHDARRFTQGLLLHEGDLYESAGGYGESALTRTRLRDARVLRERRLPDALFGEGLALIGRELVQLSWREGVGLRYDLDLQPRGQFALKGEGWGLTTWPTPRGPRLLLSDGSATLRVLRPGDFAEVGRIPVRDGDQPVARLNELEFVHDRVYANVWLSDSVIAVDPLSGRVVERLNLSGLRRRFTPPPGWDAQANVLNGIAHDPASGHLLVTGKRWPLLFELKLGDCEEGDFTR